METISSPDTWSVVRRENAAAESVAATASLGAKKGGARALPIQDGTFPLGSPAWYIVSMSGTYKVVMGDRGRLVVPSELRERAGLVEGTTLVVLDTPSGIVLMTRRQLRERVRDELSGLDLVAELLAERRAAAAGEDAA